MASTSAFRLAPHGAPDVVPPSVPAADAPLFGVFALGGSSGSSSMDVDSDPSRSHAPPLEHTNTNCSTNNNADFNLNQFARSLAPSAPARYAADEFADADLATKRKALEHLASPSGLGVVELAKLATLHVGFSAYKPDRTKKTVKDLRADFLRHRCCDECLLRRSHAASAGISNSGPLPRLQFLESAKLLRLRLNAPVTRPKRKRPHDAADDSPRKRQRAIPAPPLPQDHVSAVGSPVPDHLFRILSWDEKCDIIHEFREATGNRALARVECSFCGARELLDDAVYIRTDCLDISLLENAVARLREQFHQPRIQVFRPETLVNECYVLCADCRREIAGSEFKAIPLRSYANGLWTGLCPPELSDLTYLEEQCIARARTTSCMFKLELGASGQYASRGNVCILPHDPTPFATILPPPLSVFRDEISVILVGSPETTVTADMLLRTPILVRRQRIIDALLWLRENNPLYSDLDVGSIYRNASSYPEEGLPLPVEDFLRTPANSSEGVSYVHESSDQLHPNVNLHSIPSSTLQDLDRTDATFQDRKLVHLDLIKRNLHRYIKFPSGSVPMNTRDNPAMFGRLFPTLFPYGVGMMENSDVYLDQSAPFRKLFLKSHVAHLLRRGPDDRFQKHLSFIFVVGNIMQRRQSAFDAKLAVKKSWFPKVQGLFRQIDSDTIATYREKLKKNPFAKADTPGEKAAATLVNYVSYVAENVPGSTAEIQHMRREMYSIVYCEGLPHVFFTLNPADVLNPIAQVLAGRDIDLDRLFHDLAPGSEREKRSTAAGTNPVAASEFFHLSVDTLIHILFGVGRPNGVGIYGRVSAYYGVVEAQGRGSLHIHMLLWLKDGLSPLELLDHIRSDPQFAQRVYDWFDDVFAFSLPDGTSPYTPPVPDAYSKYPVMCRPPDARDPRFADKFRQELRDVLENVAQIHKHNDTCFKYLPKTLKTRRDADADADCRFNLPRPLVLNTHIDEEGILHLRCNDGRVNGHNPVATITQRCNTDSKPIGSGTVAMAMFGYMGNYTVKGTMDTAMIFSALCAAIKALQDNPPKTIDGEDSPSDHSRLLLIKSVNQLVGKREISSQQMVSRLLSRPSKYTNRAYPVYYWSKMLRQSTDDAFASPVEDLDAVEQDAHADDANDVHAGDDAPQVVEAGLNNAPTRDNSDPFVFPPAAMDDAMVVLSAASLGEPSEPADANGDDTERHCVLFHDIYSRPPELSALCAWDLWVLYEKRPLPKSKTQSKDFFRFASTHPQYTTHCLKKCTDLQRVPVLIGIPVPRSDREDQKTRHQAATLALFKPWSRDMKSPLKATAESWESAFDALSSNLSASHLRVISNMQLLYQSRDAKQDYSAQRRARIAELMRAAPPVDRQDEDAPYDPVWDNAMQTAVDADEPEDFDRSDLWMSPDCSLIMNATDGAGFYAQDQQPPAVFPCRSSPAGNDDILRANAAHTDLLRRRQEIIEERRHIPAARSSPVRLRREASGLPLPVLSSLEDELQRTREKYERRSPDSASAWSSMSDWQQLAALLIEKHSLNDMQTLAFLILVDNIGRQTESPNRLVDPVRLLVTGPGGTGKSQIFKAWTEFHASLDISNCLRLTGPTGVVASDIGGSTTHSEASLCVKRDRMRAENQRGITLRTALEARLAAVRTMVVNEIYFLGAAEVGVLDEYVGLAKGRTAEPFGGLNIVAAGDPCQLPPPNSKTLFDRELVRCVNLNASNDSIHHLLDGIRAFYQIDQVVVLTEIMRQKGDPVLIDILSRLRYGLCTEADKDLLDSYVLSNPDCTEETRRLTDIKLWIDGQGAPLVTFTNEARDAHNFAMSKSFAIATSQEPAIYHSFDTRGRGANKVELKGVVAEAAWRVAVKEADDLAGKVPYIPGMPVFCTENIATELGISKGSMGRLVCVKYTEHSDRRYAVSAEVDFPGYKSGDPAHPNRVLLKRSTSTIHFTLPGSATVYSATRAQLPLIPAFAFTSHNSQGRSLDRVVIDLASCKNIQSAYVMLSRVRSLKGLCILRPFRLGIIRNHISQELRQEIDRTELRATQTLSWAKDRLRWYYSGAPTKIFDSV